MDKLLKANFIWEVNYSKWLVNVVVIKKMNGKWCICVDYIVLYKVCLKYSYLLSRIDQLVDAILGHQLLIYGCLFWLQLDPHGTWGEREDCFYYWQGSFFVIRSCLLVWRTRRWPIRDSWRKSLSIKSGGSGNIRGWHAGQEPSYWELHCWPRRNLYDAPMLPNDT